MKNEPLESALASYDAIERDYVDALRAKGVKFAVRGANDSRIDELRDELRRRGAEFRNAGASIRCGWLSKACVECTGIGGSETFSTTFKCHRDCYFCFNYNLTDYDKFVREGCPWEEGLERSIRENKGKLSAIGLTGGEPLLDIDGSIEFLNRASESFPGTHMRMYTSGDLLTEDTAIRLRDAGLREIRFSVKQDDPQDRREKVLGNMALANKYIPDVVVEMPIVPGTKEEMKEWMRRFADNGIKGMNLLEFCFPFHSWDEFEKRGFEIRNPPFPIMYDYGYSGGLAVAGSEELCLELMLFGLDEKLGYGMHYCSLENKHRSEMRQINEPGRDIHPCFEFDEGDFFIKTAKVFGPDRQRVVTLLKDAGCRDFIDDEEEDSTIFPLRYLDLLKNTSAQPMIASNVLEKDENGRYLREVGLKPAYE